MRRRKAMIGLLVLVAVLCGGMGVLFQLRLGQGDVFPLYSSFRADPLGTRALYEGLRELPAVRTERMLKAMDRLQELPVRTLVLAGIGREEWRKFSIKEANALEAAVRAGSRVVVVFKAERIDPEEDGRSSKGLKKGAAKEEKKEAEAKKPGKGAGPRNDEARVVAVKDEADWARRWGVELKQRLILDKKLGALASAWVPAGAPARLPWKSDVFFEVAAGADWRTLYKRGGSPVMIEMRLGQGSVVMASDAYFLSNEAMQESRHPALIAWLLGTTGRVVFCESVLGVEEDPGIAALARRYGLAGAFAVTLLLAALFVWRRMALFVPPAEERGEVGLSYHPAASLEALLRRSVPAGKVLETCTGEWMRTARESDVAKVAAALSLQGAKASPESSYNAAVRALKRR